MLGLSNASSRSKIRQNLAPEASCKVCLLRQWDFEATPPKTFNFKENAFEDTVDTNIAELLANCVGVYFSKVKLTSGQNYQTHDNCEHFYFIDWEDLDADCLLQFKMRDPMIETRGKISR